MKNPHPEYIIDDISGEKCRNQRYYDWQEGYEAGKRNGGKSALEVDPENNHKSTREKKKEMENA